MRCTIPILMCLASLPVAAEALEPPLQVLQQEAIRSAADEVSASVVQLRLVGGLDAVDELVLGEGTTSGLVVSDDGYIVSSMFNFEQMPAGVLARLADGSQVPVELVATDHNRKLVLLKISAASDLPVPATAPIDQVHVGQQAIALGRTFRVDRPNITVGIISAKNRIFGRAVQTDAAISPANYGGPLVDLRGRVIGIITPLSNASGEALAGAEWYDSGIGFAVPLDQWQPALERMKSGEDLYPGTLGIELIAGPPREEPATVAEVTPEGAAAVAGLKSADTIVAVDGVAVRTQVDLRFQIASRYAGDSLKLTVRRKDDRLEIDVKLQK